MSGENIDLDAEIEKLTSRYGEDTILKLLMQKKRSEICKEPAAVKRRRSKTPSRKKSSDKETSESTAEESLRPFSSEEERIIQNIESGSFSAISTSTTEDSSEYSDSFPQDQAAIKSQDEAMSAVKKKKTPHISKARKSIDKDNGPSTAKDSLKRRLSMDKLTVTDVGVSGLVASKEIPYVPPATVERRRCSSPLSSVSPGKKRKQENEDEPNKERKKGDLNYSCSVTLERISVGNIVKPKPDSKQRKPMPKSVRERLELKNRKPSESKEPEMVAGASDLKLKVPMKVVKTKEHKESERAAGASESKFEIPMKNAIPKEGKEPEIAAGASEFKFKIPKKVTVPKASKEPEIAARASESKFKIPMKVTIPKVSKEPEIAAGASEPKFKKPMNAPISKEHNVLSSKLGKKSKASVKKCEVGPVRKDHRVQESVKNREMQPGGSGKGQHNVPTKGRMKYEVPPKVSATKEHQVTDKEPSPKTCLAPANENSTQETSAYEHNFLLPSVPAKRLPKAKAQTSLSNRLSDGFCNFHNAKVDEAKMDPLEKIKLEDQDLDYEEDATDNDDAISLFAESIFVIEESEDNLLRKIKHDDCDDDSSIASCGSSRHTSDIDISDSENEETQSFGAVEKENNSEVLVHQADEVSASFKAPVLGVPVENYYKDTHTSDSVDHLFNQNLNTKACKEVSLESDKPSCKRTICDVDRSENMKDVSSSSCANTVSNEQSCDQRFENYICRRDETTQQQIDTGIESSYQSADSENSAFPIVCQNKPPFSKGVHKPVNHRENRPLQTSPSRIQTEKSQTERIGLLNSSTIHPVPQNPRQPLLPTPEIQYPMVTNMPTERTNYPSTDSSSVYPFPTHSSSSGVADTMSNCGEKDMVDHLMLSKTDSDLRTMVATNSRISSCVPSIGQGMAEFLRPFCLEYLAIGKCKSVKSCPQAHKLPDVRNFVSLRDRSFLRQIFDTMISNYEFWMENKLPGEVQELGNENNRNLLFAISSFLWKKLTSEGTSKKYSLLWKNVADALSACGLSPNKVLKQILSSMEKESTTTNYYLTQALDNMFEVLFDDYIKDQDLIGESLKALNLTDYQIPEKVLKEFLKAVLKFKSVDLPVCHYLLTLPEKWRPKKLVEHDIYHLIIKLASKLHIESPKICSDLMNHFDISLQSLSIPRSCSDSSLPKKRDGKSTHRFSLQCVDLNVEGQGQGSDISSSNRVTPEEPAVSCGSATMCSSTREEEVTSSTEEIKTKEQTPDLVVAKTQPKEEAHQSKSAFTDKISIKVETGSTKRICSVLTPKPNPLDVKIVKKTAPKAGGKPSNWVMAVKRKMMGIVAKNLLAWRPTNQVRSLDAEIYEEFRKFPAAERCSMYKQLFERIESLWSPNRDDSHSKAAMIRIGLLLVNDLVSERLWQEADDVLSKINPLMEVTSEVEIESISTSTMMLMKVQVNLHNSKLLTAFQEFMVLELFKREDKWLIPNLEEDVGRRDEVASDLLEKCMDSEEFVDKGEILFREMLTFKDSYKKFDVASKFYDKVLLSLLKIKNVEAAFDLFGWASDHGLSPNTTTCRCLCLNIMELERNVQLRLSPHIVHLMELQPYRYAIPQHELDHLQSARTIIITLPSIWFSCEVRCILHYFLNAHMSKLPEFQNFPEVVLNIQEIPAPEEVPYGLTAVDSSSSAMMDRVVQVLKQFNLVGPTIQFKDNSITLDGELVKEYVAVRRNSFRTDQQTVSRCLSTRGQHILGARPVSHMPWQDRRGAERQQFERAPNHEGYGYSQPGPGFEARQQTAFSNRPQPLLSTPPLMLDQPQQGANWSPAPNHPYSFPQQARQDQETNWSQLTPSNNQPFLDYQPNFAPRPSYNLRNSYPPFGPPQGTFRGSGRKRGANRGGRRPARYLH